MDDQMLVGVTVRETDYGQFTDGGWQQWAPLLDWEITCTYADGSTSVSYCETEAGAHSWAKRHLEELLPIAGIAS